MDRDGDGRLCAPVRYGLLALGVVATGLGIVGMVLPVMPTTVFLLIALWAFSKSSARFHGWLYHHPRFGRTLRAWHQDRAIPARAKLFAVATMATSLAFVAIRAEGWVLPVGLAVGLGSIALWIVTRPSQPTHSS